MPLPSEIDFNSANGKQLGLIRVAFLAVFVRKAKLTIFLSDYFNKNFDLFASGDDFEEEVFNLLRDAQGEGWLSDLVAKAIEVFARAVAFKQMMDQWLLFGDASPVVVITGRDTRNRIDPLDSIVGDRDSSRDFHPLSRRGTRDGPESAAGADPDNGFESMEGAAPPTRVSEPSATEKVLGHVRTGHQASEWLARLSAIRRRVCRIKNKNQAMGTGFLIGPNLVATAGFVVDARLDPSETEVQFDFEIVNGIIRAGRVVPIRTITVEANNGSMATADMLDSDAPVSFGLLELQVPEGDRVVDNGPKRGWFDLSSPAGKVDRGEPLFLFHHPQGTELRLSSGSVVDLPTANRLRYEADTAPGSSGAPLFNEQFQLLGLHEGRLFGGSPNLKFGLRAQAMAAILLAKGRPLHPWTEPEPEPADTDTE